MLCDTDLLLTADPTFRSLPEPDIGKDTDLISGSVAVLKNVIVRLKIY